MTMPRGASRALFAGNGQATEFPFFFKVFEEDQLSVLITSPGGETTPATGWTAELTEGGGTLSYLHNGAPLPEGWKLAIMRDMPFVQEVDLITGTRFDPEVIETALDVATAERQQLLERLSRAVVVEPTDEAGPEALLADIRDARASAQASAVSAQANANAAAGSAQSAAGSATIATEAREAACICAQEAQAARDVAIAQAEAANTLMETELGKVNAIVAANKTDQEAAVTAARAWAEKAPDTPVEYDEDGNAHYSARHWAENAQKIAMEPPTPERRGAIRVGAGLELTTGENGETDMLAVNPDNVTTRVDENGLLTALGGNLLLNDEIWITASGTFTARVTGWHEVLLIGGGNGAVGRAFQSAPSRALVWGGDSGDYKSHLLYLTAAQEVAVTIGAGGSRLADINMGAAAYGGVTVFGDKTTVPSSHQDWRGLRGSYTYTETLNNGAIYVEGGGFGGGSASAGYAYFYGAGGGAQISTSANNTRNGVQGAVRVRCHNAAKAGGAPVMFAARMRVGVAPVTVNLYDPATGQGSVWLEEAAAAKLASGLITEEAWLAICAERMAEEHAAWLADPATEAERFTMLRAARDAKLAATDYLVAPDYPLTEAQRAAVVTYRQALRDLPAQAGAPWDGGEELTPWPEMPAVGDTSCA